MINCLVQSVSGARTADCVRLQHAFCAQGSATCSPDSHPGLLQAKQEPVRNFRFGRCWLHSEILRRVPRFFEKNILPLSSGRDERSPETSVNMPECSYIRQDNTLHGHRCGKFRANKNVPYFMKPETWSPCWQNTLFGSYSKDVPLKGRGGP